VESRKNALVALANIGSTIVGTVWWSQEAPAAMLASDNTFAVAVESILGSFNEEQKMQVLRNRHGESTLEAKMKSLIGLVKSRGILGYGMNDTSIIDDSLQPTRVLVDNYGGQDLAGAIESVAEGQGHEQQGKGDATPVEDASADIVTTGPSLSFGPEINALEVEYYEKHARKKDSAQWNASFDVTERIMITVRSIAKRARPGSSWGTRCNALFALVWIIDTVAQTTGDRLGSEVRKQFYYEGIEVVQIFKSIVEGMTRAERRKSLTRLYDEPAKLTFEKQLQMSVENAESYCVFDDLGECLNLLRDS
jgi:hypothetical protein